MARSKSVGIQILDTEATKFFSPTAGNQIDRARDRIRIRRFFKKQGFPVKHYLAAIKGQGQMTGVGWIDALNQSVRPVVAYWWLMLFTIAKFATVAMAVTEYSTLAVFIEAVWTPQDAGILSMILSFWYCDRAIRKMSGK